MVFEGHMRRFVASVKGRWLHGVTLLVRISKSRPWDALCSKDFRRNATSLVLVTMSVRNWLQPSVQVPWEDWEGYAHY
jgi:hypothetical protein